MVRVGIAERGKRLASTISTSSFVSVADFFLSFLSKIARLCKCELEQEMWLGNEPVLVELEREDNNIAWVDADGCGRAVRLVPLNAIDVDNPFFAVNLCDFSLTTLVFASNDPNFVIFANRY